MELAIALLAASVLFVAVVLIWQQGLVAYFNASETANLQQEARVGYERMTREVRLAGVQPCTGGSPPTALSAAGSNSVTVQYYSPPDTTNCATATTLQTVTYDLSGGAIRRDGHDGAGGASNPQPITGGTIGTLSFTYWDCSYTQLVPSGAPAQLTGTQAGNVARINVTISASENYNGTPLARQMSSNVHVRSKCCPLVGC
jgi:Tfp pilus assembly protein PilW